MPQDKRLLIAKAVMHKVQRVAGSPEAAEQVSIELEFVAPPIIFQKDPSIGTRLFALSHPVYPKNGRSVVLIVPKVIALDCSKINKRHGYFDCVVAAEAICKRGDEDSEGRAVQVAKTFQHFIVDARIVAKLPRCIADACGSGPTSGASSSKRKFMTPLTGLEEREGLASRLATVAKGGMVRMSTQGHCFFRVGHGGMTAGDVCENAKNLITNIRQEYPNLWKFVEEFKLSTSATESIRFAEVGIRK